MLKGVYGAAIAMDGAAHQHAQIAKNLAHAQVPGYRRTQLLYGTFENSVHESMEDFVERSSSGTRGVESTHDFSNGPLEQTGRQFDFALQGDGFFIVGETDDPLYTRNGSFTVNRNGSLITQDGRKVHGKNGPIRLPLEEQSLSEFSIDSDGRISSGDLEIDRIRVVSFPDTTKLTNAGTTLFRDPEQTATQQASPQIVQGSLEKSNVQPVQELVELIAVQRRYEAASQTMRTLMKSVEQRINLQRGN